MRALRLLAFVGLGVAPAAIVFGLVAPPVGAQTPPDVRVRIERADKVGRTPLWIPVRVTVTEGDAGRPPATDHVVFASARNGRGDQAGPFNLGTLELDDPQSRGVHEGFVIVPYGGPWTITAIVNKAVAEPGAPPVVLARGTSEMTVDAPVPASGAPGAVAGAAGIKPESEPVGVAILWLHTMVAVGWGIGVALLALLAVPAGRRFLSEYGATLLDGRLDRIARAVWWLTGLVVATGIYNLVKSVAYRVPLSPEQARRLFRLPYAQPYYLSLGVKLAAYAVMIGATFPLVAEARRRAAMAEAAADPVPPGTVDDDRSPWENPERTAVVDPSGGRVALRRKPAGAAVDAGRAGADRTGGRAHTLVAIMIVGGGVIMAAVTLLKYFHLLGEVSRLSG